MRHGAGILRRAAFVVIALLAGVATAQQSPQDSGEIPIERCDVLPVVRVNAAGQSMRFLLDTGATTILNLKAFSSGASKTIRVDSWRGNAATSAREVTLPDFQLGDHVIHDLRLPAIDLSPIGKACGGQIDGILGVDMLDRLGVTIDLQRKVATMNASAPDSQKMYSDMEKAMHHCNVAFNEARAADLEECFDPDIVLYTPDGEYRGRQQVMKYMNTAYFQYAPGLRYEMNPHDVRAFGDALWYSYDYRIDVDKAGKHRTGHGVAMCRRVEGKWLVLNMHNAETDSGGATTSH